MDQSTSQLLVLTNSIPQGKEPPPVHPTPKEPLEEGFFSDPSGVHRASFESEPELAPSSDLEESYPTGRPVALSIEDQGRRDSLRWTVGMIVMGAVSLIALAGFISAERYLNAQLAAAEQHLGTVPRIHAALAPAETLASEVSVASLQSTAAPLPSSSATPPLPRHRSKR